MRLPPPGPRRELALALLFAVIAAAFRFPGLGYPPEEYFDEVYHAKAAREYLAGQAPNEWVHPPTAKLLISVGVAAFGYHPWSWRLASAVAGTLLAPVFFLFARRVLRTERAAILATSLLLADGVYLVQSRIAMTNIFAVLFQLGAALALLRAALEERLAPARMIVFGLLVGLALSTRWTSLWAWGFLGLVFVVLRGRRLLRPREVLLALLAFGLLPVAVYVTSYVPLLVRGQLHAVDPSPNTLQTLADVPRGARQLWEEQVQVWQYHARLTATHPYFSRWWTWPWLYRPTWYFYNGTETTIRGVIALGNPALWWVAVPVTLWALVTGARRKDPRLLFSGVGFCCLYLPWGIAPRTLNFSHYLFESLPYACLSLATLLDRRWDGRDGLFARGYVVLVLALFALFLPLLMALPLPVSLWVFRFGHGPGIWTWFRTWI
jgi:dolichyl-phosphate-mannose--protein O-mannosyl transferase